MTPGSGFKIARIFGIPIYLHSTWLVIFALSTFSLGSFFAQQYPRWTPTEQWGIGLLTSLLFFSSVLLHELAHSVVAQHYKIRVLSITLFIFGGLARIARDPSKAIQEFNIAVAGPLASGLLALGFYAATQLFPSSQMTGAIASWLMKTNAALALFNLLPGFPLDGGRIFRAIVWGITNDHSRATRVAGSSGKLVAYGLMAFGAFFFLKSDWRSGIWLVFIGWFLLNAAQESVAQVAIRETLSGLTAADVMSHEIPTVDGHITLEEYGAEVLRTGRRCHLVLSDDRLVGMMNVHMLNSVPREEWVHNSVQSAMIPRERILWAAPEEPLLRLLERLLAADINQMPVVSGAENGGSHVVGMITRDSILRVVQNRTELGPVVSGR
jgi:Zn-dependent protease/predicted transcriptional regulator